MLLCAVLLIPGLALADGDNLIKNGSFDQLDGDGMPSGWYTDAWVNREGVTRYAAVEKSRTGSHAALVENYDSNDARFAQRVNVKPNTLYRLSGWINVGEMEESGRGANLSIEGLSDAYSNSIYDTAGEWKYVELYGETGEDQKELTVYVRVGGYSGESIGQALFDDIELVKVDKLPSGVFAEAWYTVEVPEIMDSVDEEEGEQAAFWPWLIVIGAAYAAAGVYFMRHVQLDRRTEALREAGQRKRGRQPSAPLFFIAGMVIAALIRILVALNVYGYGVDVGCFVSWGNTMHQWGPGLFYQQSGFCDYTPGYLYVLGFNGWLSSALNGVLSASFVHKIVPMACDLIGAYLVYRLACENESSSSQAGGMGLLIAFNPATVMNSAAWCQIDAALCVGLMLVAYLALHRKWMAVLPMYVVCILIKPQALMLGFLGLAAIILDIVQHPKQRNALLKQMGIGVLLSLIAALVIVLPFCPNQEKITWLFDLYQKTLSSYPHATVNTANLYYLVGANWDGIANPASTSVALFFTLMCAVWGAYSYAVSHRQKPICGKYACKLMEPIMMTVFALAFLLMAIIGTNWAVLGATAMALAFFIVLPMYIRGGKLEYLPLCGAVIFILLYVLGIKMHERYLFPAIFLLGMAYALRRDRRILTVMLALSAVLFINEGIILDNDMRLEGNTGHLLAENGPVAMLLAFINVAVSLFSVWMCHHITVLDAPVKLSAKLSEPKLPVRSYDQAPCTVSSFKTDASLRFNRKDAILMLAVTAVYTIITLTTLGSTKAPQNPWKSTDPQETITIDLGKQYDSFTMLYFGQVSYSSFAVRVSADGEDGSWSEPHHAKMNQGSCFQWIYLTPSYMGTDSSGNQTRMWQGTPTQLSGRYVQISANQIGLILNEVILRDAAGQTIPVAAVTALNANPESSLYTSPGNLFDEQDTLLAGEEPSWWNSTYFDEIYHARTGFEHLNGTAPYETSHPPLGKVMMSWFIGLFGMTPFGWRFAGALCGILMLPAMYLLVKQLTKRTDIAFVGMMLMALDCMHLTQTQIATIDSFAVLFIILSWLFMLRFMQRDIVLENWKKLLPDLAMSGFFMGCGFSSKWIGAYSGVGLAIMYFWICLRHLHLGQMSAKRLAENADLPADERDMLQKRANGALKRVLLLCCWCLLFFVAVPLVIYILSYIPYYAHRNYSSIFDYLTALWRTQENMLDYHSSPGLGMDHPFYSPWYEWPLMQRPMYYASPSFVPKGYSYAIFCFGNPWVWFVGLGGVAYTLYCWFRNHRYAITGREGTLQPFASTWEIGPAFILVGLLAQFLPWVLVPRGTYIYHYFASVPFLILGTCILLWRICQRNEKRGQKVWVIYLVLCLAWFILLFPYASGVTTPEKWMDFVQDYPYINKIPNYWTNPTLTWLNSLLEGIPLLPHVYH